jgi:chromosome segregation ATPase
MSSLSDRIALILQAEASPDAIAAILDDARTELLDLKEACTAAQRQVLDPLLGSVAVARARKELDESTLAASRLEAAIAHLTERHEAAREREAEAARSKQYEEAKAERDALAAEILGSYTEAATKIASLLMQMAVVDEKVAAANQDRPEAAPYLDLVAHMTQIPGGWELSRTVRLPAIASVGLPDHLRKHPAQTQIWPVGN